MEWGDTTPHEFFMSFYFHLTSFLSTQCFKICSTMFHAWYNMFHKGEIMEQDQYVKVNIKESVRSQLKEQAKGAGKTLADYIEWLAGNAAPADEVDQLLERLDNKYERPEVCLSAEDQKLFDSLEPGELPECCQEYYSNGTKCRHWHKEYVKYFGKPVLGYRNTLTGGSNYDYVNEYQ